MNDLACAYEESLDRSLRRSKGIFYTPQDIVESIFDDAVNYVGSDNSFEDKLFCDPCCGSGNFLIRALEIGFRPENIFGFDIDKKGVEIARERVEKWIFNRKNCNSNSKNSSFKSEKQIVIGDFFKIASQKKHSERFDFILTNPPWGAKLSKDERQNLSEKFGCGKSSDSSAIMMCAALKTLKKGGVLAMLLPDSFFNIGGFEDARKRALDLEITHLRDFGKPFAKLMTRAQSIVVRNNNTASTSTFDPNKDSVLCSFEGEQYRRSIASFRNNPKSIINMWLDDAGAKIVEKIFATEHITLQNRAKWALGIVTGDNKKFCSERKKAKYIGVLRGTNLLPKNVITEPTHFIESDTSQYQQVAPREMYEAPSKILYRFISNNLVFCHDSEGRYMLNSVNAIIPDNDFPIAHREVAALLSSPLMNWLFKALWRTHKILRNDIERLPLHTKYFEQHDTFDNEKYCEFLSVDINCIKV